MLLQAVLHIPLSKDAYALSDELFVIRLRTAKNDMSRCDIFFGDRVCPRKNVDVMQQMMRLTATDELFDYYEARIKTEYTRICYYFELTGSAGEKIFYSEYGFTTEMKLSRTQYFQFPFNRREDRINPPKWAADMVMYHIFPDSFADGKRKISGKKKILNECSPDSSCSMNGGTIRGIAENIDYIKSLGVNCIYLNPVFKAASYHKYDIADYYEIDPCFGTKDDFRRMVSVCHDNGVRVILDGVFNHCGSGFFAFRDVLDKGEESQYADWFYDIHFPVKYQDPPEYAAFAYVKEMPKLNTGNPDVERYFCDVGKYWVKEFGIDGWRLDVANEINHDFWRTFRKAIKAVNPETLMIGEIWEDAEVWLRGDQFDSAMNYRFSDICREFFAEHLIDIRTFDARINHMNMRYQENISRIQMNFLDTHDVPRFMSYCDSEKDFRLAVFFMMTAVGVPSVFYGDECGISGAEEKEYRRPMQWDDVNGKLTEFYRKCIQIRSGHKALRSGDYQTILADDDRKIYVYSRNTDDEKIYAIINLGADTQKYIPQKRTSFRNLWENGNARTSMISCPPGEGRIYTATE
jgi:cyclomaltodextrinase